MALSTGYKAEWADVTNIYKRAKSELSRWGRSDTTNAGSQGSVIQAASLRQAMIDLANNISFLSSFRTALSNSATINAGTLIKTPTLVTIKDALNGMRTVFGYVGTGTHFGTYGTGFSGHATSKGDSTSKFEKWDFFNGGCFCNTGSNSFSFTVNNTTNNYCANCSSGFYSCNPYCTAGYCASYFNAQL